MGGCPRFEIHGSYSALEGSGLRRQVTKTEHSGALDYLDVAATPGEEIELGWMGGGFRLIDASVPCVVRSRSLRLLRIDRNRTVVISYHDAI